MTIGVAIPSAAGAEMMSIRAEMSMRPVICEARDM